MKTDPATSLSALKPCAKAALGPPEPAAKRTLGAANPSANAVLGAPSPATAAQPGSIANSTFEPLPSTYLDINLSYLDLSRPISTEKIFPLGTRPGSLKPFSYPLAASNRCAKASPPPESIFPAPQNPQLSAVNRAVPQLTPAKSQFAIFSPQPRSPGSPRRHANSTKFDLSSTKFDQIRPNRVKKFFLRKTQPVPTKRAKALFESFGRRRSTVCAHPRSSMKSAVKPQRRFPIEIRKSKFENNLQLLALSCTYSQLLAANCSSNFFSHLPSTKNPQPKTEHRSTASSTSASRNRTLLNLNYTALHQTTPIYTKKFSPTAREILVPFLAQSCSVFIQGNLPPAVNAPALSTWSSALHRLLQFPFGSRMPLAH